MAATDATCSATAEATGAVFDPDENLLSRAWAAGGTILSNTNHASTTLPLGDHQIVFGAKSTAQASSSSQRWLSGEVPPPQLANTQTAASSGPHAFSPRERHIPERYGLGRPPSRIGFLFDASTISLATKPDGCRVLRVGAHHTTGGALRALALRRDILGPSKRVSP